MALTTHDTIVNGCTLAASSLVVFKPAWDARACDGPPSASCVEFESAPEARACDVSTLTFPFAVRGETELDSSRLLPPQC